MSIESEFPVIGNESLEELFAELGAPDPLPPQGGGEPQIKPGGLYKLIVPEEDLDLDPVGQDLDFSGQMLATVRRPDPQRWFAIIKRYWLTAYLLPVASTTSEFAVNWYYVSDEAARHALRASLKGCMVLPCYLMHARVWTVWVIPISTTKWWNGVEPLFRQEPGFYDTNVFRVMADRSHGCYRIWSLPVSELVPPASMPVRPSKPAGEMLGDTLRSRVIDSISHQVVLNLTRGTPIR